MAIAHGSLTDSNGIHEPKGASTALAETWYVSNGAGSGSWKKRVAKIAQAQIPTSVSANTTSEQTHTVTGVVYATDTVINVVKPTYQAGLGIVGARITADNEIKVTYMNCTASPITPTNETYTYIVYRT